ncbi:prepilin-type N-terminal cleavage/methylation domain-containing protein [Candidatus Parcubacteria bacterium]|nr:MAG: prepilin-type N-terminal cleavage/methylation domain-containing protein [Candidatus Parcubacteria bacterium]
MNKRGFTIIELLVVVTIIGLLSSIVIASLTTVRIRARDTRRMEDISTLQKALTLYATNGAFPVQTTEGPLLSGSGAGAALIAEGALPAIPQDPLSPTYEYEYVTNASGGTYTITFCLETNTIPNYSQGCTNQVSP